MLIHTTKLGTAIHVEQGNKSKHDFRVIFIKPRGRKRTPKHIHLIVEMYVKEAFDKPTTMLLRDYLLNLYSLVQPVTALPKKLQVYQPAHVTQFSSLDAVGEFSVEFFLVANELIFIQEKTNYPNGSQTQKLYSAFGVKERFTVISQASWRGKR